MFTLEYVKNPVWVHEEQTRFDCVAKFAEIPEELPFSCGVNDQFTHAQEVWQRTLAGEFGEIAAFVGLPGVVEGLPQPVADGVQNL